MSAAETTAETRCQCPLCGSDCDDDRWLLFRLRLLAQYYRSGPEWLAARGNQILYELGFPPLPAETIVGIAEEIIGMAGSE